MPKEDLALFASGQWVCPSGKSPSGAHEPGCHNLVEDGGPSQPPSPPPSDPPPPLLIQPWLSSLKPTNIHLHNKACL